MTTIEQTRRLTFSVTVDGMRIVGDNAIGLFRTESITRARRELRIVRKQMRLNGENPNGRVKLIEREVWDKPGEWVDHETGRTVIKPVDEPSSPTCPLHGPTCEAWS